GYSFGMPVPFEHRDPLGEKRHCSTSVRDDEADIRAALQRTAKNKIDDGARRVKHIFDNKRRRAQIRLRGRFAMGRMNKHHCLAPIELVKNGIEQRIAEVAVVDAGKKADTVEVQDVERIRDFFQRAVYIGKREESEGAESRRMLKQQSRLELVARAGYIS